jgi:hypothetical protein
MDLDRIVKELQDLAEEGSVAFRRLRESAGTLGRKQLADLRVEARKHLVERVTALAVKLGVPIGGKL